MAKKKTSSKAKTKTKKTAPAKSKRVRARTKPRSAQARVAKPAAPKTTVTSLPDVEIETTNGGRLRLSSLRGKNLVLYFYPKDNTSGCATEGCDLRDRYPEFQKLETVVLGVSRDSLKSHEGFKAKYGFPFELVTDGEEKLCRAFGVMQPKSLYGRKYIGVDRSTFIFDKSGKLRKEFRGVRVPGHADAILEEVRKL